MVIGGLPAVSSARDAKLDDGIEVFNVDGAGGTLGLSQLASKASGDPYELMMTGLVMIGAIETNQSQVDLDKTTPIATMTTEAEAIVVAAKSKYKTLKDLTADRKRDPASIRWAVGSAGSTDQLLVGSSRASSAPTRRRRSTSRTPAAVRRTPRSSRARSTRGRPGCPRSSTRSRPGRCACSRSPRR
jgi:hypothetical protein